MALTAEVDSIAHELSSLDFHHPFTPYDVQNQFMQTVYQVLETGQGQVGILESPTGTVCIFIPCDKSIGRLALGKGVLSSFD